MTGGGSAVGARAGEDGGARVIDEGNGVPDETRGGLMYYAEIGKLTI